MKMSCNEYAMFRLRPMHILTKPTHEETGDEINISTGIPWRPLQRYLWQKPFLPSKFQLLWGENNLLDGIVSRLSYGDMAYLTGEYGL